MNKFQLISHVYPKNSFIQKYGNNNFVLHFITLQVEFHFTINNDIIPSLNNTFIGLYQSEYSNEYGQCLHFHLMCFHFDSLCNSHVNRHLLGCKCNEIEVSELLNQQILNYFHVNVFSSTNPVKCNEFKNLILTKNSHVCYVILTTYILLVFTKFISNISFISLLQVDVLNVAKPDNQHTFLIMKQ